MNPRLFLRNAPGTLVRLPHGGSVRLSQIVEDIFYSPFIRIVDLQSKLGVTYPTAKSDVERLVRAGILSELSNVSPKTYYAPDVFNVAYDAME